MRRTLSRRPAVISAVVVLLLCAERVETARRPKHGGELRLEISEAVQTLVSNAGRESAEEVGAKAQIVALVYDLPDSPGKQPVEVKPGPFVMAEWDPGNHAVLKANSDYRKGRPFLNSVQIQMGRSARDMLVDLELGRTDLAEIPVEQARRATDRGVRVSVSKPDELLAVVFPAGRAATEDARVREALAAAIDRASLVNFILQKNGEAAGGLLPQWSSGTAFLFSTAADAGRAKELWAQITGSPKLVLGYDSGDSLEQSVAERIVVNAKEAGISVTAQGIPGAGSAASKQGAFDARLMRLRMTSPLPRVALTNFLATLGPVAKIDASPLPDPASPQDIYDRERAIVSSYCVVSLVWLPQVYGLSARVRNWKAPGPGETWPLADVWLEGATESAGEKEKQ